MRKGFLVYEEMRKYFPIYEEAVSYIYIWLSNCYILNFLIYEENLIFFFYQCMLNCWVYTAIIKLEFMAETDKIIQFFPNLTFGPVRFWSRQKIQNISCLCTFKIFYTFVHNFRNFFKLLKRDKANKQIKKALDEQSDLPYSNIFISTWLLTRIKYDILNQPCIWIISSNSCRNSKRLVCQIKTRDWILD
jgi:hypothetical protein